MAERVVDVLRAFPCMTQTAMARALGARVVTVRETLRSLVAEGRISAHIEGVGTGGRRPTRYVIEEPKRFHVRHPKRSQTLPNVPAEAMCTEVLRSFVHLASLDVRGTRRAPLSKMARMTTTNSEGGAMSEEQLAMFHVEHPARKPRQKSALDIELSWWCEAFARLVGQRFKPESDAAWRRERAVLKRLMERFPDEYERHAVMEHFAATLTDYERQSGGSLRFLSDQRLKRAEVRVQQARRDARDRDKNDAERRIEETRAEEASRWREVLAEVKREWNTSTMSKPLLDEVQRRLSVEREKRRSA